MKANEMTFGCEIETFVPSTIAARNGLVIGGYKSGIQVPYLPQGWKAERDGSINGGANDLACEIVSPILTGAEGLAQVKSVVQILRAKGHKINNSCGVHVHVGWKSSISATVLARLIVIVSYCEKGLFAITGTKDRERGAGGMCYCKSIRFYGDHGSAKRRMDADRYHILNLRNLASGAKETVEFRNFSASLNPVKVCGWIQVCLGLVERAQNGKRSPVWTPAPLKGGWAKKGQGAAEVERLIGYLCWAPGYAKNHGGNMYGWLGGVVSQDAVKTEFRRMSKKYDEMI